MKIQPVMLKKALFYKKMLYFVNIPIMIGLPLLFLSGIPIPATNPQMVMLLCELADMLLFFNSYIIFKVLSQLVVQIDYKP
mmetsp:Transcript_28020/g.27050  ORF Transcript_28020/g.27050 Transcript_28020/m.27050 type:complete len:81 (+) Transcript_28020:83-325(+)